MKLWLSDFIIVVIFAGASLQIARAQPTSSAKPLASHPEPSRGPGTADQTPPGLAGADWQSIREAYEAGRHAFQARDGGGWQARNPGQGWAMEFDGRGFLARPQDSGWSWGLELKSYGCGDTQQQIGGAPVIKAQGQQLSYQWDTVVQEWFINDQRGLEHGFTVAERPAGTGPLTFVLATRGTLNPGVAGGAASVSFQDASGATVLTYAGLKVWDADGRVLPSHFEEAEETRVRLVVDERGARYPVTIDPIAQQAFLKAGNAGAGDRFGTSVAVSGNTVVVGAPEESSNTPGVNPTPNELAVSSGAAYVFLRSSVGWTQQAYLKASNPEGGDGFGCSVAISGDTLVVGADGEDSSIPGVNKTPNESAHGAGAAYVFVRTGAGWSQQAYLKASNPGANYEFGYSVAISGESVVVGSDRESSATAGVNSTPNTLGYDSGAAYVFIRSGTGWTQQAYLKASNSAPEDYFGYSVAVSGDTVVVGAYGEDSSAPGVNNVANESADRAGAAYVFVRSGTNWTQQAYLKASNPGINDEFGTSVGASGETVVVGAWREASSTGINTTPNEEAFGSGAAYVFVRSGTAWTQQAYLKASNPTPYYYFGFSAAISGDTVVIGAQNEDSFAMEVNSTPNGGAENSGAAYVFTRSGTAWRQQAFLKASNTGANDLFGNAVAVSGNTVVAGAPQEDSSTSGVNGTSNETGEAAGAAYIFDGVGVRGTNGAVKALAGVYTGVDLGFVSLSSLPGSPSQQAYILNGGGWSANEGPEKAVDENINTVFGNLGGTDSGFIFFAAPFDQITFYTRGNPLDADPIRFQLWARNNSNAASDPTNPPSYLLSSLILIASGTLSPPPNRPGVITVKVPLLGASAYLISFPDLRGPAKGKLQIAEISIERSAPVWDSPFLVKNGRAYEARAIGVPGFEYSFYRNDSLDPNGWDFFGNATAGSGTGKVSLNDPATPGSRRFYRVVEKGFSISP